MTSQLSSSRASEAYGAEYRHRLEGPQVASHENLYVASMGIDWKDKFRDLCVEFNDIINSSGGRLTDYTFHKDGLNIPYSWVYELVCDLATAE